jgi:hypothetical protein
MMAEKALKIWLDLPADVRSKILNNVWCPHCRTAVTICDYNAEFDSGVVVLRGFCATCGHKVARVLEGYSKKPQKARKCALEYYIFNVWLYGAEDRSDNKRVIRKIQIAGTKSLYSFARIITKAFGFYFDHCFGFYDTLKDRKNCKKAYELFVDIGEEPTGGMAKGVKKVKISQAFENIGEKMMFLFDYGDGWQFNVELEEIRNAEKWDLKPIILESIGEAPLQYPPCEDEFEDEKQ